jgi:hypothetical protein
METSDSLEGPKLKIERAKSHIRDLVERDAEFFSGPDGPPYIIRREPYDKDPAQECFKVKMIREIDAEFPIIIGEVIHNLRSALDHLTVILGELNCCANTRQIHFPVGRDKAHFELPETQKKIKALSPDAQSMIRGLKPYKGGNDLLWAMHECSLVDKHNSLISVAVSRQGGPVGSLRLSTLQEGYNYISVPQWNAFDKEAIVLTFPKGATVESDDSLGIILSLSFREIDVIKGKSVIATLKQFVDLTKNIVSAFERRFFAQLKHDL